MPAESRSNNATPDTWRRVVRVLEQDFCQPDIVAVRVVLSAVAAHKLKSSVPVWVLAIAPPGSAKTIILESLRGLPSVHFVDEVTPKTFLSGKIDESTRKRSRPASLLHRIGSDGFLVAADFGTYTADPKTLGVVLAQAASNLRRELLARVWDQ